jgi:hypothetical protein
MRLLAAAALLAGILANQPAVGQAIDGDVVGAIYDPSGAVVPGAAVELLNQATGIKTATQSGADGTYRFSNVLMIGYLIPGNATFAKWDQVFASNSRGVQLGARVTF